MFVVIKFIANMNSVDDNETRAIEKDKYGEVWTRVYGCVCVCMVGSFEMGWKRLMTFAVRFIVDECRQTPGLVYTHTEWLQLLREPTLLTFEVKNMRPEQIIEYRNEGTVQRYQFAKYSNAYKTVLWKYRHQVHNHKSVSLFTDM